MNIIPQSAVFISRCYPQQHVLGQLTFLNICCSGAKQYHYYQSHFHKYVDKMIVFMLFIPLQFHRRWYGVAVSS